MKTDIKKAMRVLALTLGLLPALCLAGTALAGDTIKMDLWVDPATGIIYATPGDGRDQVEVAVPVAMASTSSTSADAPKAGPVWWEMFDVWADLRLRYEYRKQDPGNKTRSRGRYRFRLGAEAHVNEQVALGAEFRSGSGDPRSDNTTFSDSSAKFDIRIAKAYAKWTPTEWLTLAGGQMSNPLWRPSNLMWDGDINPQGAAVQLEQKLGSVKVFATTGLMVLDQVSSDDPLLLPFQAGVEAGVGDKGRAKASVNYYAFTNLRGRSALPYSKGTNSTDATGKLAYDYDAIGASAEFYMDKMEGPVPYVGVFGDYIRSFDPSEEQNGWQAGVAFGHKKMSKLWDWQLAYNYRSLERDAVPDFLPDSDTMDGKTGVAAHEVEAKVGLGKHVELGIDFYKTDDLYSNKEEYLVQADISFKAKP